MSKEKPREANEIFQTAYRCNKAANTVNLINISGVADARQALEEVEQALVEMNRLLGLKEQERIIQEEILRLELCVCVARILSIGKESKEREVFFACMRMQAQEVTEKLRFLLARAQQVIIDRMNKP